MRTVKLLCALAIGLASLVSCNGETIAKCAMRCSLATTGNTDPVTGFCRSYCANSKRPGHDFGGAE